MNAISILNPVQSVTLSRDSVEVRQMPFLQALQFLKEVSGLAGKLFDAKGNFLLAKKSSNGVELDLQPLQDMVSSTGDLAVFLLKHSTGKDDEWISKLSAAEGMTVLKAAIEINLSPEILKLGNDLAGFLVAAFTKKTATKEPAKQLIS